MRIFLLGIAGCLLAALPARALKQTVVVGAAGSSFSPASFTLNPGDTVAWVWGGGFHNTESVTLPAGAGGWASNLSSAIPYFEYVPTVSGLYRYTCTFHSGMDGQFFVTGCSFPAPPLVTTVPGNRVCAGTPLRLATTAQAGCSYQWLQGSTTVAGGTDTALSVVESGVYRVLVNRCGMDVLSAPVPVRVDTLPRPSFSVSAQGLHYRFTNTTEPLGAFTYTWRFSDTGSAWSGVHAERTFPAPGTFTVVLRAVDTGLGCTAETPPYALQVALDVAGGEPDRPIVVPNPARDRLYARGTGLRRLRLVDATGKLVAERRNGADLDLQGLAPGVYLLLLDGAAGPSVARVLVAP